MCLVIRLLSPCRVAMLTCLLVCVHKHARMLVERIIILADKSIKIVTNLGVVFALHTVCHKLQR